MFSNIVARRVLAGVLGAAGGFAYYYFVGCASGTCPITSNPLISTAYGALVGLLLVPSSKKGKNQTGDKTF